MLTLVPVMHHRDKKSNHWPDILCATLRWLLHLGPSCLDSPCHNLHLKHHLSGQDHLWILPLIYKEKGFLRGDTNSRPQSETLQKHKR